MEAMDGKWQRQTRAAQNEALFRDVNEHARNLKDDSPMIVGEWLCECADTECTEHIELTMAEYEQVRAASDSFAVAPDHVSPDVEVTTWRSGRYWVVRKLGTAGNVAAQLDPRTDEID